MEYLWIEWVRDEEKYPMIMPYGWRIYAGEDYDEKKVFDQAVLMVGEYNKYLHKIANIS